MKTRRLASAAASGSVEERCAQACGLVSRTIARRDGGTPTHKLAGALARKSLKRTLVYGLDVFGCIDSIHGELVEPFFKPTQVVGWKYDVTC